ncbi:MAG: HdeD family acid-resistance protein [Kiritimatiellae bacterium]|nr:HdeD family acid-resistance protein [Kiritimatiellia bacterium]
MNDIQTETSDTDVTNLLKKSRTLLVILGILSIFLGFAAIGAPLMTGSTVTIIIGSVLLMSGVFELIHAFSGNGWKAGIFDFISGALAIIGGGIIISRPIIALSIFTLILASYFVIDGITRIIVAFKAKPQPGWGVLLVGGLASLILGVMIWRRWPLSGLWAIGVLVGIKILFAGWSMLFLGAAAGNSIKEVSE